MLDTNNNNTEERENEVNPNVLSATMEVAGVESIPNTDYKSVRLGIIREE